MPDIISAKCFGCGNVVKVPAALGGKKARCPKCTNTITIPALSDTSDDLVGDELLPEVAREDEELEGKFVDDDGNIQDLPPPPSSSARRESPARNTNTRARGNRAGRGTGSRGTGSRGPAPKAKSSTGLIIGIVVGVVVLGALFAVAMGNKGDSKSKSHAPGKKSDSAAAGGATPESSEDQDLWMRCLDYTRAVNSGSHERILKFYDYTPDDEKAVGRGIYRIIEQGIRYESPVMKSSSAATGAVSFSYSGGEKTLTWKKVNGQWLIAEKP